MKKFTTIDEYIATFPKEIQEVLQEIRVVIQKAAPNAQEAIGYQLPSFKQNGKYLVYFAAWKNHIGFYPIPSAAKKFSTELSKYKSGKGSVQFPLNEPMPLDLIKRIVEYRVNEVNSK